MKVFLGKRIITLLFTIVMMLVTFVVDAAELKIVYPPNGLYSLQPMCAPKKELTVHNASTANGANVIIWDINSNWHTQPSHQKWYVQRIGSTEWYKILAENSGSALNIHNGIAANGTNVSIWPFGGNMHKFRFLDAGNGYYVLQGHVNGAYVLDVSGASNVNGANVQIYQFNNSAAQKWKLVKRTPYSDRIVTLNNGWYKILSANTLSKGIDVRSSGTSEGSNVILYQYADTNNQKFYLENKGSGWFTLKAGHCNKYVSAANATGNNYTNIQINSKKNNNAQLWRLIDAGNGYYYIESKLRKGLSFDCANGGSANYTNIQLWDRGNVLWNKWKFTKVSAPVNNSTSQDITKNINAKLDSLIASWKGKKWDNRESSKIGSTCFGFANYIFRELNGVIAGSSYNSGRYKLTNQGYGVKEVYSTTNATYNNMHNFLLTLNSGAFIQGNKASGNKQHSMIFCSYNASNKTIKVFDANWATNPDNVVRVHDFTLLKFIERFPRVSFYQK